jgi:hypothetical protein
MVIRDSYEIINTLTSAYHDYLQSCMEQIKITTQLVSSCPTHPYTQGLLCSIRWGRPFWGCHRV